MPDISLRRAALIGAVISSFLTPFMGSAINVALPSIARQFGMGALQSSFVTTAYLLSAAIFLIPFGRLSDIHGRKRIFLIGLLVYTIVSIALMLVADGTVLIVLRFVQGIGGAMIFGTGATILVSVFPREQRGTVLGINVTAVYLGASLGPVLGGLLVEFLTWRSIFAVNTVLSLIALVYVALFLKGEWADARGERFDVAGSAIYGISLLLVLLGFARCTQVPGMIAAAIGVAGLAVFAIYESRIKYPVLSMKLFTRNRAFLFTTTTAFINYSATYAVGFLLSLYLQYVKGLAPSRAGLVLLVQPVVQAALSPFAGRLADRHDAQSIASVGMAVTAVGLTALIFLGPQSPVALVAAGLALLGTGFGFFSSPNTAAVANAVEKRQYAVAMSTVGTMRVLGQVLSMAMVTISFALTLRGAAITPENHGVFLHSMRILFIVFATLCALGVFLRTSGRMRGRPDGLR